MFSCASCQEDPRFNVKLYNGRPDKIAIERSKTGEVIKCWEEKFINYTCAETEEVTREVRRLQRCCAQSQKNELIKIIEKSKPNSY